MAGKIILSVILIYFAWEDIRKKQLLMVALGVAALAGIGCNFFIMQHSLLSLFGGVAIGACMLPLSKLSNDAIGQGDAMLFMVSGIFLGFFDNFKLLLISSILASVYASILLLIRKQSRKTSFPFVPFVLISSIAIFLC